MKVYEIELSESFSESDYIQGITKFYNNENSAESISTNYIRLEELNLNIHDGYLESFIEGTDQLNVDFTFWAFQDLQTKEFLYSEQGSSLLVCISNFTGRNIDEIYKLNCELVIV